ncbi:hypothetical protein BX257_4091 [Streptomyces sp. 3212.3]|nr:hypothetical protein BX257_4091 [Streptomyces sp. 3212.3]
MLADHEQQPGAQRLVSRFPSAPFDAGSLLDRLNKRPRVGGGVWLEEGARDSRTRSWTCASIAPCAGVPPAKTDTAMWTSRLFSGLSQCRDWPRVRPPAALPARRRRGWGLPPDRDRRGRGTSGSAALLSEMRAKAPPSLTPGGPAHYGRLASHRRHTGNVPPTSPWPANHAVLQLVHGARADFWHRARLCSRPDGQSDFVPTAFPFLREVGTPNYFAAKPQVKRAPGRIRTCDTRFRSSFLRPKGRACGSLASCSVSGIDFPGTAGCTGVAVKDCSQTRGLDVFLPWVLSGISGSWVFAGQGHWARGSGGRHWSLPSDLGRPRDGPASARSTDGRRPRRISAGVTMERHLLSDRQSPIAVGQCRRCSPGCRALPFPPTAEGAFCTVRAVGPEAPGKCTRRGC